MSSKINPDIESIQKRINIKAWPSLATLAVVCIFASYIVGSLDKKNSKVLVYSYRLFSRGFLQVSNALYDSLYQLEKYKRNQTVGDLESAYIRLKSGKSILMALRSEARIGKF